MARSAICQRSGITSFENATELDTGRLRSMCLDAVAGWRLEGASVRVRYSRGADFSGSCCYQTGEILINLGRHLTYPYSMATHLARARAQRTYWWKPIYTIELADGYAVVLFVFLHECFHLLVKRAGRNTRQKESMCDRFAARWLADRYGAGVYDESGKPVARAEWDFQDLDAFVAAARRPRRVRQSPPLAARNPAISAAPRAAAQIRDEQLLLFEV